MRRRSLSRLFGAKAVPASTARHGGGHMVSLAKRRARMRSISDEALFASGRPKDGFALVRPPLIPGVR